MSLKYELGTAIDFCLVDWFSEETIIYNSIIFASKNGYYLVIAGFTLHWIVESNIVRYKK